MLYCRSCGQCQYLGDDLFYEIRSTSGWERVEIDNESGETVEYGDSEITDSEHCNYECPHCSGEDVEFEWDGTNEEAVEARNVYQENLRRHREESAARMAVAKRKKQATYIARSIIEPIDHILDRLTGEDVELVIKIKVQKQEDENEAS